ncbi:MAG TPA: hypothetical protein VHH88_02420, partial [Verrucomicrobiae bacterium]|nr:hypothetical protein [Verrucomicrobiae bacterium]
TITASSSTPGVLPDASVQITGTGATRFLNVTPLNPGSSVVTIFVSDAEGLTNALVVRITAVQPAQVSIPDAALANVLSGAIGKPAGQLQNLDLLSLTALYAESSGITTLSGLEWASNLTALDLAGNTITNISTIQNLAGLSYLNLDGNPIGNAAPIGALTHLAAVSLDGVGLKDLAFLQPLGLLESLSVMSNSISDITPISSVGNLAVVMLDFNTVTDLAALVPLPDLVFVSATMNLMDTRADSPAMGSILNLLARPLSLQYLPQRSAPTLAFPANWEIPSGARSFMSFAITPDFGASLADVRVSSANNARIPNSSLSFTMDNAPFWNLGATPAAQSGTAKLTVVATDNFGLSSTGVVTVTIFSSQSLADASFGPANLDWRTWGANSWFEETTNTHNGISAAQSGTIGNSQETWLTASVNGPGRLSFWWRTSSEPQFDWLEFYINQSLQDRISGESGWQSRVFNVPPGSNILAWHYTKDVDGARGLDAAWVSEVTFDPGVWLEIGVLPPNQGVQLTAYGIPGHGYEIDVSTNLLDWVPLESFTATNAATSILDSAGESTRFYRMRDLTVTSLGPAFPSRPWQPDDIIIAENSAATRRRGDL